MLDFADETGGAPIGAVSGTPGEGSTSKGMKATQNMESALK